MARILVAEDSPEQAELIRRYAVAEGHDVVQVGDGRSALDRIRSDRPDLLVLDLMMPGVDGLDVCRILRADPATAALPVLVVSARSAEDDLLLGLDLGADDYLRKPYSLRELMARIRSLLRRSRAATADAGGSRITIGALTLDVSAHLVTLQGAEIDCTPGEFAVLAALAERPTRVFSREQLLAVLHGHDAWSSRRTVDTHVANLRKKLGSDSIRTVYAIGYSFGAT